MCRYALFSLARSYCHMYEYVMLKSLRIHHCSNMLPTYVATKCTPNELLFDTYVNNKLLNGMPSVVAFYYQLHSLLFHYYFHVHYRHMYGYVMLKSFRQHHSSNMLPTYVATKN